MAKGKKSIPPTKEERRSLNKENFGKLYSIFKYILPYKWKFILGLLFLVAGSLLLMAFPFLAGKLVDIAGGKTYFFLRDIETVVLLLFSILIIQSLISYFRVYLFSIVSEKAMADLRYALYSRLIFLPLTFYDQRRTGELMSRVSSDVSLLQTTFSTTLAEFIRQIVTLLVGVGAILVFARSLTLFMLAIFPVVIVFAMIFGRFIRKLSKKTQDELAKTNVIIEETLQAITSVKAFTSELYELARYNGKLGNTVSLALKTSRYRAGFISFLILGLFGSIVAVMWYGANLVQTGEMLPGELFAFVLFTVFIGGSIAGLGDLIGQVHRAIGSSERIIEILGEEQEDNAEEELPKFNGNICYQNISFSYPTRKDMPVLSDVSFDITAGQKVALVGPSGAGKSTIVQLLMRFYDLAEGDILIDEKSIKSYHLQTVRRNIGIVPQEVILFGGSILENIKYGKPQARLEEIIKAAKKANALDFIESFPEGFETLVGERGVKLSGGQRQRIAIARAILKDPAVLILDEATSSLDAQSEFAVQQSIETLMEGRTTIIIAHRLATVRNVDKIFVLESGEIVESGNHEELLTIKNGVYNGLVKLQMEPTENT